MPFPKGQHAPKQGQESSSNSCGICGKDIEEDTYVIGHCSKCGTSPYHCDCVSELQCRAETHNSKSREKMLVRAKHHPDKIFLRMRCPFGIFEGEDRPDACNGKIVQADLVKPAKAASAPPPLPTPRAPRQAAPEKPAAGTTAPKKPAAAAAPKKASAPALPKVISAAGGTSGWSTVGGSKSQSQLSASSAASSAHASARELRESLLHPRPSFASAAAAGGRTGTGTGAGSGAGTGGGIPGNTLRFPAGQRPKQLAMCDNWREYGECRIYNCEYAHGEEELAGREGAFLAEQERKKVAERQRQLEEHKRKAAAEAAERQQLGPGLGGAAAAGPMGAWGRRPGATGTGASGAAGVMAPGAADAAGAAGGLGAAGNSGSSARAVEAAFLKLSDATLSLMREHKHRHCVNSLLEMGFDDASAQGAADATGCDAAHAVQMLMEGGWFAGAPTQAVDVAGEAQELLGAAAAHGFGVEQVEVELVLAHGDWEAAAEALQLRAAGNVSRAAAAASHAPPSLASIHPSQWSEAPTPIPLSPTPSQAALLAGVLPPGTTASSTPRSSTPAGGGAGAEEPPPLWDMPTLQSTLQQQGQQQQQKQQQRQRQQHMEQQWQHQHQQLEQQWQQQQQRHAADGQWAAAPAQEDAAAAAAALPDWAEYPVPSSNAAAAARVDGGDESSSRPGSLADLSAAAHGFHSQFGGLAAAAPIWSAQGGQSGQSGQRANDWGMTEPAQGAGISAHSAASQAAPAVHAASAAASSSSGGSASHGPWPLGGFSQQSHTHTHTHTAPATSLAAAAGGTPGAGFGAGLGGGGFASALPPASLPPTPSLQPPAPSTSTPPGPPAAAINASSGSSPFDLPTPVAPIAAPAASAYTGYSSLPAAAPLQQLQQSSQPQQWHGSNAAAGGGEDGHAVQYGSTTQYGSATQNGSTAGVGGTSSTSGFDAGFQAGMAAVLQQLKQQQLSRPTSAAGAAAAGAAAPQTHPAEPYLPSSGQEQLGPAYGYSGYGAAHAAAPAATAGSAEQLGGWGALLGDQQQPGLVAASAVSSKGAALWGVPGSSGPAEEDAELQDYLSLLCT